MKNLGISDQQKEGLEDLISGDVISIVLGENTYVHGVVDSVMKHHLKFRRFFYDGIDESGVVLLENQPAQTIPRETVCSYIKHKSVEEVFDLLRRSYQYADHVGKFVAVGADSERYHGKLNRVTDKTLTLRPFIRSILKNGIWTFVCDNDNGLDVPLGTIKNVHPIEETYFDYLVGWYIEESEKKHKTEKDGGKE